MTSSTTAPATDHTAFADTTGDLYHDGARAFGEREIATMRARLDAATALLRAFAESEPCDADDGRCVHCDAWIRGDDEHEPRCRWVWARTLLATVAR